MSTTANLRGGYIKTLHITRDNSNSSQTRLLEPFLDKADNYILQIPRFIMSSTPPLNLISEIMFEILPRGDEGDTPVQASQGANDLFDSEVITEFKPTIYRSWSELARQMHLFFTQLNVAWGAAFQNATACRFSLLDSGQFQLLLSISFCRTAYIEVGPRTQLKTGFPQFLFQVAENEEHFTHQDGIQNLLDEGGGGELQFSDRQDNVQQTITLQSEHPLSAFDDRLSIDCQATFPQSSRISSVDGVEQREILLCRFPYVDQHGVNTTLTVNSTGLLGGKTIEEELDIGLTDVCNGNPNTASVFLLAGSLQTVFITILIRYLSNGVIESRDMDFGNGFWNIECLFSKKKV